MAGPMEPRNDRATHQVELPTDFTRAVWRCLRYRPLTSSARLAVAREVFGDVEEAVRSGRTIGDLVGPDVCRFVAEFARERERVSRATVAGRLLGFALMLFGGLGLGQQMGMIAVEKAPSALGFVSTVWILYASYYAFQRNRHRLAGGSAFAAKALIGGLALVGSAVTGWLLVGYEGRVSDVPLSVALTATAVGVVASAWAEYGITTTANRTAEERSP